MSKKELILHIGSHKTGTSAIQNSLHINKNYLNSKGIYYDNYNKLWNMHHNLAFGLFFEALDDESINFTKNGLYFNEISENPNEVMDRINKDLESNEQYNKIIISSEGLFGPGNFFAFHSGIKLNKIQQQKINKNVVEKLFNLLSNFDIKVVCYLRRQDLLLESFYNQYCKAPNPNDLTPLPTFEQYSHSNPIVMDYFNEIFLWAEYFGKENVLIRPYEKQQMPSGVVYDFYVNILGFTEAEYANLESIPSAGENSRINRDVLEYKKKLQIPGLEAEFLIISENLGETNKNQFYLLQDERENILNECKESNERLAIDFLQNDGQLFLESEDHETNVYNGLTVEKSIEISSELIKLFLNNKIQNNASISYLTNQLNEMNKLNHEIIEERERFRSQSDNLKSDNEMLLNERDSLIVTSEHLKQERDCILEENESLKLEGNLVVKENQNLKQERDIVVKENQSLKQERDIIVKESESLKKERDLLIKEIEELRIKQDDLNTQLNRLYASKSWKITKPLRDLARIFKK